MTASNTYEIERKMTAADGPRWRKRSEWEFWDSFSSFREAKAAFIKHYGGSKRVGSHEADASFRLVRVTRTVVAR